MNGYTILLYDFAKCEFARFRRTENTHIIFLSDKEIIRDYGGECAHRLIEQKKTVFNSILLGYKRMLFLSEFLQEQTCMGCLYLNRCGIDRGYVYPSFDGKYYTCVRNAPHFWGTTDCRACGNKKVVIEKFYKWT